MAFHAISCSCAVDAAATAAVVVVVASCLAEGLQSSCCAAGAVASAAAAAVMVSPMVVAKVVANDVRLRFLGPSMTTVVVYKIGDGGRENAALLGVLALVVFADGLLFAKKWR